MLVRQWRAVDGGQGPRLDLVPQLQRVGATQAQLASELRGGGPLGDPAEDQEDRRRVEVRPLPEGAGVQVEDPAAALAAEVEDQGIGVTTVDVESLTGGAAGAGQAFGVEQVHEFLVASGLIHQILDREIIGSPPRRTSSVAQTSRRPEGQVVGEGQPPIRGHEPPSLLLTD